MVTRRTLLQAVVLAGLASGCNQGTPSGGGTTGATGRPTTNGSVITPGGSATEVRLELARAPRAADPAAGAAMLGAFAGSLLGAALKKEHGNLILSPWSITAALGMNRAGAAGRTAEQIDAAMHVPPSPAGFLDEVVNTGSQLLDARNETIRGVERSGEVALRSANSTWAARDITWKRPFLETLARYYGSGVRLTDFAHDPEAARAQINAWVSERTKGRIPELVPRDSVDRDTLIAVVNALYFKAPWAKKFEETGTTTKDFALADGTVKRVQMMHTLFEEARSHTGDGWLGVTLPYLGAKLAFTAVLPAKGREAKVADWLVGGGITALLADEGRALVDLTMPKFQYQTSLPLEEVMLGLGIKDAFDPGAADYSGMTDDERICITAALHQATIAVDEEGTEATAATAIIGGRGGAGGPVPVVVVLDRPFFLVIHDVQTRIPLFVGRVADPTVTS